MNINEIMNNKIESEFEKLEEEMQLKRAKELSEYEIAEKYQLCQEYGVPCEYGICDECVINLRSCN